jgi:hypothetical protein
MQTVLGWYSLIILLLLEAAHIASTDDGGKRLLNFALLLPMAIYVIWTLFA